MSYKLFLDDLREVSYVSSETDWKIARTSLEALKIVFEYGMPKFISFDHDLGNEDTAMVFLKQLYAYFPDLKELPEYQIHSANPIGKENIISFMESWKRSLTL